MCNLARAGRAGNDGNQGRRTEPDKEVNPYKHMESKDTKRQGNKEDLKKRAGNQALGRRKNTENGRIGNWGEDGILRRALSPLHDFHSA